MGLKNVIKISAIIGAGCLYPGIGIPIAMAWGFKKLKELDEKPRDTGNIYDPEMRGINGKQG